MIARADPLAPDVLALLRAHLAFVAPFSPPEDVHALAPCGPFGVYQESRYGAYFTRELGPAVPRSAGASGG